MNRSTKTYTPRELGRLAYWEKDKKPPCPFVDPDEVAEWEKGYNDAKTEAEA